MSTNLDPKILNESPTDGNERRISSWSFILDSDLFSEWLMEALSVIRKGGGYDENFERVFLRLNPIKLSLQKISFSLN